MRLCDLTTTLSHYYWIVITDLSIVVGHQMLWHNLPECAVSKIVSLVILCSTCA